MKKSMIFFAALFVLTAAATEEAVRKTVMFYRTAAADMDVKTALTVCAPEYVEINNAMTVDYKKAEEIAELLQKLLKSNDAEEILVIQNQLTGQKTTEQQLVQIRAVKGTEHEKTLVKIVKNHLELTKQLGKSFLKDIKFPEIRVEKDKAFVVQEFTHPVSKKLFRSTYELVKRDGKWLIVKVVEAGEVK